VGLHEEGGAFIFSLPLSVHDLFSKVICLNRMELVHHVLAPLLTACWLFKRHLPPCKPTFPSRILVCLSHLHSTPSDHPANKFPDLVGVTDEQ
jgi:hypothetical protein